jgi:hypothetical protein
VVAAVNVDRTGLAVAGKGMKDSADDSAVHLVDSVDIFPVADFVTAAGYRSVLSVAAVEMEGHSIVVALGHSQWKDTVVEGMDYSVLAGVGTVQVPEGQTEADELPGEDEKGSALLVDDNHEGLKSGTH